MITTTFKKRKKLATASALLLAVMLTAAACSDNKPVTVEQQENVPSQVDKLPDSSGLVETGVADSSDKADNGQAESSDAPDNTSKQDNSEADQSIQKGEGIFAGIIDSHSVEIETKEGYMAFQYASELTEDINKLNADATVKFSYTIDTPDESSDLKQYNLVSIEAK